MIAERLPAGWCQHCRIECADRLGSQIYPGREDLAAKIIWCCPACDARVGSHPDGSALGTAANGELRRARVILHSKLDPIWEMAWQLPDYASARDQSDKAERMKGLAIIKRTARKRVYRFLSAAMGLERGDCHVAMFSLEECRTAWTALKGIGYPEVRAWAKDNPEPEAEPKKAKGKTA